MSDLREALKKTLAAFKSLRPFPPVVDAVAAGLIKDAEAALAQPEAVEPVAWLYGTACGNRIIASTIPNWMNDGVPLYTTPPHRP